MYAPNIDKAHEALVAMVFRSHILYRWAVFLAIGFLVTESVLSHPLSPVECHKLGRSPEPKLVLQGHKGWVYSISFSHDGRLLASAGADMKAQIWDLSKGITQRTLSMEEVGTVTSVSFSHSGKSLAIGIANGFNPCSVQLWDGSLGKKDNVLQGHKWSVTCLAFLPSDNRLLTGGYDGTRLWNLSEKGAVQVIPIDRWVTAVAVTASMMAVATEDDEVFILNARGEKLRSYDASPSSIPSLSFSPDGKTIAIACNSFVEPIALRQNRVLLLDTSNAKMRAWMRRAPQKEDTSEITAVAFSPCGKYLAASTGRVDGKGGFVILWEVASKKEVIAFRAHAHAVTCVSFSPGGKQLATAGGDSLVKVWDLDDILVASTDS